MKKLLCKISRISFIKTLILNVKYFGLKGLLFPILVGKRVELKTLKGKIHLTSFKTGTIQIGVNEVGHIPSKTTSCVFDNNGDIVFGDNVYCGIGTAISNHGILKIGSGVTITALCRVNCYKKIVIGEESLISWETQITDSDVHKISCLNSGHFLNKDEEIIIGRHCWICNRVSINKGSRIGSNCIIASNSIISQEIMKDNVIIGTYGKILKENISWTK